MSEEVTPPKPKVIGVAPVATNVNQALHNEQPKVTIPTEVAGHTFNIEQLPTLSSDEGHQAKVQPTLKPVNEPVKTEPKVEPKKEEVKPVEVKKEDKKEESNTELPKFLRPPAGKEQPKVEGKKEDKKDDSAQFDYTGYSDSEVLALKNMSKESRAFTAQLIKQNKELFNNKQSTWFQHPEAYQLMPEFQSTRNDILFAREEAKILNQQIEDVKLGKKIKVLEGWDDKGNPKWGNEIEPTGALEEQLRIGLNNVISSAREKEGVLLNIRNTHATNIQRDNAAFEQELKNRFMWEQKPELLDYTMQLGNDHIPLKKIREDFTNFLPKYYHGQLPTRLAANLFVALLYAQAELTEARNNQKISETKREEALRGEPSSEAKDIKVDEKKVNGVTTFSLEGMPT